MRRVLKLVRNLFLLILAAVAVLAGVLLINTFARGSRQIQVAAIPRASVDAEGAATLASRGVRLEFVLDEGS